MEFYLYLCIIYYIKCDTWYKFTSKTRSPRSKLVCKNGNRVLKKSYRNQLKKEMFMEMIEGNMFVTSDGAKFLNKLSAKSHENELKCFKLYDKLKKIKFFTRFSEILEWDKDKDLPNFQYYNYQESYEIHSEGGDRSGVITYVNESDNLIFQKRLYFCGRENFETLMILPLSWLELNEEDFHKSTQNYIIFRETRKAYKDEKAKKENSIEGQILNKLTYYTQEQKDWIKNNINEFIELLK